ncbi:MAG TPA: FMN-binding protein [Bacillota bacterium]|nr:FMN-binding protein [Bacillota bacterium]
MDKQKTNVDAVSGATTTSKALLKAVESALSK